MPLLHTLKKTFIPQIVEWLVDDAEKSFFRKLDGTMPSWVDKLKFEGVSASLRNYRVKQEAGSRLPIEIFEK